MSDKLFCGVCVGTDQQHALWEVCPEDAPATPRELYDCIAAWLVCHERRPASSEQTALSILMGDALQAISKGRPLSELEGSEMPVANDSAHVATQVAAIFDRALAKTTPTPEPKP